MVVSTPAAGVTAQPSETLPVPVPGWLAPLSSPNTLSPARVTWARVVTEAS